MERLRRHHVESTRPQAATAIDAWNRYWEATTFSMLPPYKIAMLKELLPVTSVAAEFED